MKRVLKSVVPKMGVDPAKGAVIVELAIILPFLALMLVVIADLGLVIRDHQVLGNAAREGARFSSLPKNWVAPQNPTANLAAIQQYVVDYCAESGLQIALGDVSVVQNALIDVGGRTMKASEVTVTTTRDFLFPAAGLLPSSNVTLRSRAVFRNLY